MKVWQQWHLFVDAKYSRWSVCPRLRDQHRRTPCTLPPRSPHELQQVRVPEPVQTATRRLCERRDNTRHDHMLWKHLYEAAGRLCGRPGRHARGVDAGLHAELHRPWGPCTNFSAYDTCASTRRSKVTVCCTVSVQDHYQLAKANQTSKTRPRDRGAALDVRLCECQQGLLLQPSCFWPREHECISLTDLLHVSACASVY